MYRKFLLGIHIPAGGQFVDIGVGTGNFSMLAAAAFPNARILHLDSSSTMNAVARNKARDFGIKNIEFFDQHVDADAFSLESFDCLCSLHSLYDSRTYKASCCNGALVTSRGLCISV